MFDQLDAPEVTFDRWGRYVLSDPFTHNKHPWMRVTTFAKTIVDSYGLNEWQQRMVLRGLALRPDLAAMASTMDVTKDRKEMNKLVEQAKDAAGQKVAANKGTAVHKFAEETDAGRMKVDAVPESFRPDINAYRAKVREARLTVIPEMQEKITCLPSYQVAGRLDKVVREADGTYAIGDVKSGQNLKYNQLEIAIQLSLYAHGVNSIGVWDGRAWTRNGVPTVRTDYAVVMHLPAGGGVCELHRVDILAGWEAVKICAAVREERNRKGLFTPYEGPQAPLVVEESSLSWEDRFGRVQSRGEASELYREAVPVFGMNSKELNALVQIGLNALKDT